jgi:hypothetical protein
MVPDGSDAAADVEVPTGIGPRERAPPRGDEIVGGEAMSAAKLKHPPVSDELVEGFVGAGPRARRRCDAHAGR